MLKYYNYRLIGFITPVLLFCFVFFTGCVTSGIETVESDEFETDHRYIKHIYHIKLNNGKLFTDRDYYFEIEFSKEQESRINCISKYPADSLYNISTNYYENFSLSDIRSAKVKFKDKPTMTGYIIGGLVVVGFIAFLFVANGARNERK